MQWAFDYVQRDGEGDPDERTWLRDETGGSVYLRLTTSPLEQPGKRADDAFRQGTIDGAYWLRPPGPNCEVVIAYQGAVASEAIKAAGMDCRDILFHRPPAQRPGQLAVRDVVWIHRPALLPLAA